MSIRILIPIRQNPPSLQGHQSEIYHSPRSCSKLENKIKNQNQQFQEQLHLVIHLVKKTINALVEMEHREFELVRQLILTNAYEGQTQVFICCNIAPRNKTALENGGFHVIPHNLVLRDTVVGTGLTISWAHWFA